MSSTRRTLPAIKASTQCKLLDEKASTDRQRDALILVHSFLLQHGYIQTTATLAKEAGKIMSRYENADNIDLLLVFSEFEEFYELKYGKRPKFSRRVNNSVSDDTRNSDYSKGKSIPSSKNRYCGSVSINSGATSSNRRPTTSAIIGAVRNDSLLALPQSSCRKQRRQSKSIPRASFSDLPSSSADTKTLLQPKLSKHLDLVQNCKSGESACNSIDGAKDSSTKVGGTLTCLGSPLGSSSALLGNARHVTHETHNVLRNPTYTAAISGTASTSTTRTGTLPRRKSDDRIIKPLPSFEDSDMRNLASSIQNEILDTSPGMSWDDIIGLDDAKRILDEAVSLPQQYPDLFCGILTPWRGALLFGEPGNGKTLLAKALASETMSTFFNLSASSLCSKYRGDSEKLIRVTFELARYHSPSTIFLDEIDAIMGHRGGHGGGGSSGNSSQGGNGGSGSGSGGMEHEGSRRMKTELLMEMDGINSGCANGEKDHVFVLAATNLPWDLDPALLRRLEKRILIPMPSKEAKKKMLLKHLSHHVYNLSESDLEEILETTDRFSGADMKLVCKEAIMGPVRKIIARKQSSSKSIHELVKENPVTIDDFRASITCTRPSTCSSHSKKYLDWAEAHGSA